MTSSGGPPWRDSSVEGLLDASLRPGADREPPLSASQLRDGARRRAGQIRRRRSAAATALGTGALVALTFVAVPALRGAASPDLVPPAASVPAVTAPVPDEPSSATSAAPSSDPSTPVTPAVEPLGTTAEGLLLVPDDVEPAVDDLPADLGPAVSDQPSPSGAFLQNVVPACAEPVDEGSPSQIGRDLLGSRTWSHPGVAEVGASSYAEARVDLFSPDDATTALLGLTDRAGACADAGLGLTVVTGRGEDLPGADGYLLVTGTTPGVEGGPEVAVLPAASALVVVRVGDVLVRGLVVASAEDVTGVDESMVVTAEQLVAAYLDRVAATGTAQRLAVTP